MNRESFGSNRAYNNHRALTFTTGEMQTALQLIETVCRKDFDGTLGSLDRTVHLAQVLFQDPLSFFEQYFAAMDSDHNRQLRAAAIAYVSRPEFTGSIDELREFSEGA